MLGDFIQLIKPPPGRSVSQSLVPLAVLWPGLLLLRFSSMASRLSINNSIKWIYSPRERS